MRLYLVRHGETTWNLESRYQGHTDVELSDKGLYQGELLGKKMAKVKLDAIYASDLSRAYQTAQCVAKHHQLAVNKDPLMRELHFGEWEGLTYKEIKEKYGDLAHQWFYNPVDLQIPKGEHFRDLATRAKNVVDKLLDEHQDEHILVVSHGGTIRTIICNLLEIDLKKMWAIKQDNTAVNIIDFYDRKPIIALLNDTSHLE